MPFASDVMRDEKERREMNERLLFLREPHVALRPPSCTYSTQLIILAGVKNELVKKRNNHAVAYIQCTISGCFPVRDLSFTLQLETIIFIRFNYYYIRRQKVIRSLGYVNLLNDLNIPSASCYNMKTIR